MGHLDSQTPFYNAFKNGGLCFLDEIDASESRALLELHKIVDTIGYHPYIFPNCEKVNPHPNFTIVAAANTWGTGGDRNYTAREKMDDATIHKFMQVSYDYDDNLSKKFLSNHSDILEVINYYNQALKEHGNNNILSPGDMSLISYFLNTNIVTWNDIIEDMLKESSIFLMSSYTESFGIVLIEAMSYGLPCIAFTSL